MKPGDLLLTHRNSPTSKLIWLGQRIRFRGKRRKYAHWTHAAIVLDEHGTIVEALADGVQISNLSKYADVPHCIVDVGATALQRDLVIAFAVHEVGLEYGFVENFGEALYLAFGSMFEIGVNGQTNCSAHAAGSLSRTAAIFPKEPMFMLPADLAEYYSAP